MPLEIILPHDTKSMEIQEYINTLDEMKYDLTDHNDIIDSAKYLNQLSNNKSFLIKYLCEELRHIANFQKSNYYGPQVFIIHTAEKYFIRAVVWSPVSKAELAIKEYKYDICHDHNFDILTIGHFGPGYVSQCYTYDNAKVNGLLGENVEMINDETLTLSEGKIVLYRAKKDIHIQLPPSNLSISLNLMPRSAKRNLPQFQFDEETSQLCKYIQLSGSELIIRMAGILGNENFLDILNSIFKSTANPHIKALTALSIIQISPDRNGEIEGEINKSNNVLVKDLFIKENVEYGSSLNIYSP